MKKALKSLSISIILLSLVGSVTAQNDKIFHVVGVGFYSSYFRGPSNIKSINSYPSSTGEDSLTYNYGSTGGAGIFVGDYTFRYTLWQASDAFSIGVDANPSLSLGLVLSDHSDAGLGGIFSLPVYVSVNFGEGSTYSGAGSKGGFIGAGYEFNSIFGGDKDYRTNPVTNEVLEPVTNWGQMSFIGGIRWWSRMDRLKEISVKYGYASNASDIPDVNSSGVKISQPYSMTIMYRWFINY